MTDRLIVVGGDAAGMTAASVARRRRPDLDIVVLERSAWTSYSACGIPYLVGGEIRHFDDLVSRTPEQFRAMRIDVRTDHEVTDLDLVARTVTVDNRAFGRHFTLGFDQLHLATGATPSRPAISGLDADHVHGVQTLDDAQRLLDDATSASPGRVVVIGSGYIGLELAEAFLRRGASVTVIERSAEVMSTLDPDIGHLVGKALRAQGVDLRLEETLTGVEADAVTTSAGTVPADLVVLGLGVEANSSLADAAGLDLGVRGSIVVDRRQQTSAEGVWAAGDCCQSVHVVSGRPVYEALGTVANKQGRVAGINLAGGYATFPGVTGTAITRLCHLEIARTGLNEAEARAAGFRFVTATTATSVTAGYLPDPGHLTIKMLAEVGTGRVLGAQIVGSSGSAKRIDVVATAIFARLDVEQVMMLDLAYAPPFSSVWDPVQVVARELVAALA